MGTDPGRNFFGGPGGDLSNVGLVIPAPPTTSQHRRYYARLAALQIASRYRAHITSMRQMLTIAAKLPVSGREGGGEACDPTPYVLIEREVKAPFWSFPDGNVQWYLRHSQIRSRGGNVPAAYLPGWDNDPYGLDSSILYLGSPPPIGPYTPPANGMPFGDPLGIYGTMRGIQFPWWTHTSNQNALELEVEGPAIIGMYASIWQTDPVTRPVPGLGPVPSNFTTEAGLEEEDKFWIAFPCARYYRIAAELTVELEELPRSNPKRRECRNPNGSCPLTNESNASAQSAARDPQCMQGEEP